ncbi:MAG: hypothetical protein G01um101456_659 [Parcubacteria group bacterium Gr01-1014_56]|nr:MAG: hypothetical protein G01um101456_659 [Parcubacteria group bacterium Gr01-1014_56]
MGKGHSFSIGIILLVVVALVSWFGYNSIRSQSLVDQTLREQFQWSLIPAQPDPVTPGPRTSVNLTITEVSMPLGTYAGSCEIIDGKTQALLEGEISGVVCRSSESGVEIGIFRENEQLILKKGIIESGSTRGSNFEPIVKQS